MKHKKFISILLLIMGNSSNNKIYSIDGNIGSGKSTLLQELTDFYENNPNIIFLKEPVEEWSKIKDKDGQTMLQKFYADQEKYSFPFQMMAFISRLSILKKTMKENKNCIIITERSLFTDKFVFAQMLFDKGKIEDVNFQIYLEWFNEFAQDFPVENVIYVKTDPNVCYERIKQRSRDGEDIPLDYLEECHYYHEYFLKDGIFGQNKLILDGNQNIFENEDVLLDWIEKIDSLINKIQN